MEFCKLHPNLRSANGLKKITMQPFKMVDKNGIIRLGRSCHKCGHVVWAEHLNTLSV